MNYVNLASYFPKGLITLWEVKEYLASRLAAASSAITNLHLEGIDTGDELDRKSIKNNSEKVAKEADYLSMKCTAIMARRIAAESGKMNVDQAHAYACEIEGRFEDELKGITLFHFSDGKEKFYNQTMPFGEAVRDNLPTCNLEAIEASNCFAFENYTASVFHLCRATESALKVFISALGMPPMIKDGDRNWGVMIKKSKEQIDVLKKMPPPDWDKQFFEEALAFFEAFKNPLRNGTMHVENTYSEKGAENVYNAVNALLSHLATKLKE